ncbi:MAG: nucleotidyltransferase family protein [Shimia sp.]
MPRPCMIFAAGFGTRMRPLTDDRPKPLIEVAGRPLLDHALAPARAAGCAPIVVNAHYLADQIVTFLAGSEIEVQVEAPTLLDTGGGLKAALPRLRGDAVATMNADAVWAGPNPFDVLEAAWRPGMGALLACVPPGDALGRTGGGDFALGPDGRLRRGGAWVYTGAQIVETAPVAAVPDDVFSLNRVWDALAAEGRLFGVAYPGRWCDLGRPENIALAETLERPDG